MNVAQIISNKRDGQALTENEIELLVAGYAQQQVPEYQMAAFAMAVYFQGMTPTETAIFTRCMIDSGDRLNWPSPKPAVDKHSTGGIGDKISIPLAPLLACCGVEVPMISGRGLGTTGGTLDKLEAIKHYRTELTNDEFRSIVNWNGCSIASASSSLAPADKRLYALRDVTATVPSIPLITASILSKKVAEGIDALVLDVKWGTGAFMKTIEQARDLAQSLVTVGNQMGVKTSALITDMNQPLGKMIGNALEINESVEILKGEGPSDATELMLELGSRLLVTVGVQPNIEAAKNELNHHIVTGDALCKLEEMVESHGGNLNQKREIANQHVVVADDSGYLSHINADRLGLAVIEMGGGRKQIGDPIDHSTGIEFLARIGDQIEQGQPIAHVFCSSPAANYAQELVAASYTLSDAEVEAVPLVVDAIG